MFLELLSIVAANPQLDSVALLGPVPEMQTGRPGSLPAYLTKQIFKLLPIFSKKKQSLLFTTVGQHADTGAKDAARAKRDDQTEKTEEN